MESELTSKRCLECGETKILKNFSPDKRGRLGRVPRCRPCRNKIHRKRYPRYAEYYKKWRKDNETKIRKYFKAYCQLPESRYREYKRCAKRRSIVFEVTKPYFIRVLMGSCHYCGDMDSNGIDRVNSSVGYRNDNIVPCCKICNIAKGIMSADEFILFCRKVAGRHRDPGQFLSRTDRKTAGLHGENLFSGVPAPPGGL